jgi:hypothetical protein
MKRGHIMVDNKVNEHCDKASDSLQRAAEKLEQAGELRKSVERIRVSSIPAPERLTPSVILIRDAKGDLRVKKE